MAFMDAKDLHKQNIYKFHERKLQKNIWRLIPIHQMNDKLS